MLLLLMQTGFMFDKFDLVDFPVIATINKSFANLKMCGPLGRNNFLDGENPKILLVLLGSGGETSKFPWGGDHLLKSLC